MKECYPQNYTNHVLLFVLSESVNCCPDFAVDIEHLGGGVLHQLSSVLTLMAESL